MTRTAEMTHIKSPVLVTGPKLINAISTDKLIYRPGVSCLFWRKIIDSDKPNKSPVVASQKHKTYAVNSTSLGITESYTINLPFFPETFNFLSIVNDKMKVVGELFLEKGTVIAATLGPNPTGNGFQFAIHYATANLSAHDKCVIYCTYPQEPSQNVQLMQNVGGFMVAVSQDGTVVGFTKGYMYRMQLPMMDGGVRIDLANTPSSFGTEPNAGNVRIFSSKARPKLACIELVTTVNTTFKLVLAEGFPHDVLFNNYMRLPVVSHYVKPAESI